LGGGRARATLPAMWNALRKRTYRALNATEDDLVAKWVDTSLIALIATSIVAVVLESEHEVSAPYARPFLLFEWCSSLVFSAEYVLRVWTCVEDERYAHPLKGRLRWMRTPMALVDLVAILPFYLSMVKGLDLRFVRAIRLLRLLRVFKIGRYAEAVAELLRVFAQKKEDIAIVFFLVMMTLILASSAMYYAENAAQPEAFRSIPASMWWGVITLTTVGYGDVGPITPLGKLIGGVIALIGVGIVALPAGIIASGFSEATDERRARQAAAAEAAAAVAEAKAQLPGAVVVSDCPCCGKELLVELPRGTLREVKGALAPTDAT
jgi:voltage-gated potassium channel